MADLRDIIDAEMRFPDDFAEVERRPWGRMYHTPGIPDSHDGNHAVIARPDPSWDAAIDELVAFYRGLGIEPRVNQDRHPDDADPLRNALTAKGFRVEDHGSTFFVRSAPSRIAPNSAVTVRRVREVDDTLAAMVEDGNCPRARKVVRRRVASDAFHLLVGHVDGRPVSMASVQDMGYLSRVDSVLTHPDHRGRGYGRALIDALVRYHAETIGNTLYLYADNPVAIRIYREAGFTETMVQPISWSAWMEERRQ